MLTKTYLSLLLVVTCLISCPSGFAVRGQDPTPTSAGHCAKVAGAAELIDKAGIILLGELHGTAESPAFAQSLVCQALDRGRSVTLALEQPAEQQDATNDFLHSAGNAASVQRLLAEKFWKDEFQDGRRSQAMLQLLDYVRAEVATKRPVELALIDTTHYNSGAERDLWMGKRVVEEFRRRPGALMIVLTGNLHTRRFVPGDNPSMGAVVTWELEGTRIVALDARYESGTAWFCTTAVARECGAAKVDGSGPQPPGITLFDHNIKGYDGTYFLGHITASLPAVSTHLQ